MSLTWPFAFIAHVDSEVFSTSVSHSIRAKCPRVLGSLKDLRRTHWGKLVVKDGLATTCKTTQPPPNTWKAFSTERKEICIHFVLCCHTSSISISLSLRSTNCKGNQEEPKVENVSNCQTVSHCNIFAGLFLWFFHRWNSLSISNASQLEAFGWIGHVAAPVSPPINPNLWVLNFNICLEIAAGIRGGSIMSFTVCWFSVTPRCNISSSLLQMSLYWLALKWILSPLRLLIVHLQLV